MQNPLFIGAATALITPFKEDGSLDLEGLKQLIELQIENGISAIVVAGTTGEASTLRFEEYSLLIAKSAEYINHRVPLIAGSGSNNTATAIRLSLEAEKRGANALLIVTPYYNKTTQNGLIQHYYAIADRVSIPIILYNIPGRTGLKIEPKTCKALSVHPNIIGIKDAGNNISETAEIAGLCNDILIYSGNDDQILPFLSLGGTGVISVLSNIAPSEVQRICYLYQNGEPQKALALHQKFLPLIRLLFEEVNPIPIKAAAKELNLPCGSPRLPLVSCTDALAKRIRKEMEKLNLI
ncbi:MAG: 4-hydroxy-tetrahydrodipicolinate synthase [Clostridia bacterium]|nr:4-hydroxy-tetrahydrodipicolinate synthase [Clostridia bacterium]